MAVFRVERNKGYTVMSNHHLRNKELSLKAKGLLSQMLSLPEDWDYTLAGLSFINREKIDAIREAVKELERAGYIVRSRERDEKGRLRGTDYVIFEQPQTPPVSDLPTLENPTLDNPTLEKPTQEKPTLENPTQLNKDIQKTNLPKKEKSNIDLSSTDSIPIHSLNPLPYDGEAAEPPERKRKEATDAYSVYEEIIKDNIEYDHKPNPGLTALFVDAFRQQTEPQKEATSEKAEKRDPEVVAWENDEITSIEVKTVEVNSPIAPMPEEAPKAHRLTAEEKEIKAAVMDTLKGQIAYNNDGMRASYRASNHSFNLLARNGVRIEGNTVTQNGEPLFKIHRRHAARKTQGCYRELMPTLEYVRQEQKQEKPSIRDQLRTAAKQQPEKKSPVKSKTHDMEL